MRARGRDAKHDRRRGVTDRAKTYSTEREKTKVQENHQERSMNWGRTPGRVTSAVRRRWRDTCMPRIPGLGRPTAGSPSSKRPTSSQHRHLTSFRRYTGTGAPRNSARRISRCQLPHPPHSSSRLSSFQTCLSSRTGSFSWMESYFSYPSRWSRRCSSDLCGTGLGTEGLGTFACLPTNLRIVWSSRTPRRRLA